jgi:2-haloalkanoic acid dehalogenase type II
MKRYDAVLFDLLTGLLDSWSLWNAVAGDAERGRAWREEYLRITYRTGSYRSYEALVEESALNVGLSRAHAVALADRFVELQPWPEAGETLRALKDAGMKLGVVTNCPERLGQIAAARVGVTFDSVVTAEPAGFYKPDARPYLLAVEELNVAPGRCLFVAGSAYDLFGTAKVGIATYSHDRIGMTPPMALRLRWRGRGR